MKTAIINASPKIKNSNCALVLNDFKYYLGDKCELIECKLSFNTDYDEVFDTIKQADAWVFAFPLYVDNMPSHLLKFLEWLNDSKPDISNKHVYAITNCGFYEGIQAKCAINIVHYWCDKTGNIYGGSVGVGGGEAFDALKSVPVGYGPKASIDKALNNLSNAVLNQTTTDDRFENLNYPRFLYKLGATGRWKKLIRKNGGKVKDLGRKLS